MKLVVASDEKTELTNHIIKNLEKDHELTLLGALVDPKNDKWVEIGKAAAKKVASGEVEQAILFCWSGTGICMAANRIKGARAALCWNPQIAKLARKWDDANILCLALVNTKLEVADKILKAWFLTKFDEEGFNEAYKLDN